MKRLKIVEQIIIVLVIAVLAPFVTIGIIISNVSQQSVRTELANNTYLIAQFLGNAVENYVNFSQSQLNQIASGFNYIPKTMAKIQYFDEIESKSKLFKNLDIIEKNKIPTNKYNTQNDRLTLVSPIDKDKQYYLVAQININIIDRLIGEEIKRRKIYIFDNETNSLIFSNVQDETKAKDVLLGLNLEDEQKQKLFSIKKNTPKAYYKLSNPDWYVIVDTTKKVTAKTITKAKYRIILSLSIAALSIIIIICLYTYYLYINIRQLFKGITAISKGNYDKKIHLIKRAFTPHEIVFLAKEFNYMANKINVSYKDLKKKNKELKKLNEFRENLVNATSHEFRTPLTSIIGYSSRLMRQDIVLDEAMKMKSLKIIKEQAQMLSRMVEDLLVIPEIESFSLKFLKSEVNIADCLEKTTIYCNPKGRKINLNIDDRLPKIISDEDRVMQILLNLVDNAIKYSEPEDEIDVNAQFDGRNIKVELHVAPADMGKVIGKQGRIAKAMRTVVKAASVGDKTKVDVDII